MNPKSSKLQHQEQQRTTEEQVAQNQPELEFASVGEMLRYDAAQTTPPPAIEVRLKDSLAGEPKRPRSWWGRLLSRQSPNP